MARALSLTNSTSVPYFGLCCTLSWFNVSMIQKTQESGERPRNAGIQVIERAASILRLLESHPEGLSLGTISKEIGLARSTVQRIVVALTRERFLIAGASGIGVRLGPGLISLGSAARSHFHGVVRPHLKNLSSRLAETVDLSIRDGQVVVFIDQATSDERRLRAVSAVGLSFPLHCCANGKALLAAMDDSALTKLVPLLHLERLTENTITSRKRLLEELEIVRRDRFSYDREEQTLGICAVGSTVIDPFDGHMAISVAVPATRFYNNESELADALLACCENIQIDLSDV
jgi:DNA-binding IclR family transcriptional regulator